MKKGIPYLLVTFCAPFAHALGDYIEKPEKKFSKFGAVLKIVFFIEIYLRSYLRTQWTLSGV